MPVKETPLTKEQIIRLRFYCDTKYPIKSATLCEIIDTLIKKILVKYQNGEEESFFPDDDKLSNILNGLKLERNK